VRLAALIDKNAYERGDVVETGLVIVRSESDEAIQIPAQALDCFAGARNDEPKLARVAVPAWVHANPSPTEKA
jgi:hypothetical protein